MAHMAAIADAYSSRNLRTHAIGYALENVSVAHSLLTVLTIDTDNVRVLVMDEPMTTKRWKELHKNKTFQEAARQLRAAGYVKKMRGGVAVWLPIGQLSACVGKTRQMRITDAELTLRVREIVSENGGVVTVPQIVKALKKAWNASIQRRVTGVLESIGMVRNECVARGIWSMRNG